VSFFYVLVDCIENLENAAVVPPDVHGHEETLARTAAQRGIESLQGVKLCADSRDFAVIVKALIVSGVLRERSIERVIVTGAATEGRVVQSAIDAREDGFKATILQPARATASADLEETALAYASLVGGVHLAPSLLEARGDG
jgi:hypothetical protein